MTILFDLQLSTRKAGFARGPVRGVEAAIVGQWIKGRPYTPDRQAVRECLPHYYRKALDRAGSFWFPSTAAFAAYITLRDTRGKYLNTVYAQVREY